MDKDQRAVVVADKVRRAGGVVRATRLQLDGASKRDVARGVELGLLVRERRVWVAVPDADPLLRYAARAGAMLSCVSQARRLGLWVEADDRLHLACRPNAAGVGHPSVVTHWKMPVVPRDPHSLIDPIENVLDVVAHCQPYERALAVWDSALNKGLVELDVLTRLDLQGAARRVAAEASPFRDSGLESFVPRRLRWLRLPVRSQIWLLGHRVDFLIGERLVLQIDGRHHVGAQRTRDIEHDAKLMLAGYHVIRVGYEQVVHRWPEVQETIMRAVAQRLHRGMTVPR